MTLDTIKVIIEKSRGGVSLMGQDTIENVSEPIRKFVKVSYIFDALKCATIYGNMFVS